MTRFFQVALNRPFAFILTFVVVFLGHSCKEDSSIIGLDIQPKGTLIDIQKDSTIAITAKTIADDNSFVKPETPIFGKAYDSIFGGVISEVVAEVYLEKIDTVLADTLPYLHQDSAILTLYIGGATGEATKPLTINIFELRQKITHFDTTNRQNIVRQNMFYPVMLAQQHVIPKIGYYTFKLPAYFQSRFVANHRKMHSQTEFGNFFNGLYFAVDQANEYASLVSFDLQSKSKITFYYSRDSADTVRIVKQNFVFYGSVFNYSQPDYSANISNYLNDTAHTDTLFYLMSGNNLIGKIDISNLSFLYRYPKIVINKASLIISAEVYNESLPYTICEKLVLKGVDENGTETYIPDYLFQSNTGYYYDGASYNQTKKQYEFSIPLYIQDLIKKQKTSCTFFIHPYKSSSKAQKVVLKNTGSLKPIKLIVTYSII